MNRLLLIGGLAVAASCAGYGILAAFDAAEQRHLASIEATFERVAPVAPAIPEGNATSTGSSDALAWENVRHLRVRRVSETR